MRRMPSYCKNGLWLSLLQAISHSENTYINTEKVFLYFKRPSGIPKGFVM